MSKAEDFILMTMGLKPKNKKSKDFKYFTPTKNHCVLDRKEIIGAKSYDVCEWVGGEDGEVYETTNWKTLFCSRYLVDCYFYLYKHQLISKDELISALDK